MAASLPVPWDNYEYSRDVITALETSLHLRIIELDHNKSNVITLELGSSHREELDIF